MKSDITLCLLEGFNSFLLKTIAILFNILQVIENTVRISVKTGVRLCQSGVRNPFPFGFLSILFFVAMLGVFK